MRGLVLGLGIVGLYWASPVVADTATAVERADRILQATGVRGGVIVHIGCGAGELTAALRRNDRYLVFGLDVDASRVAGARRRLVAERVNGPVSVDTFDGRRLPLADGLVNLVVSADLGRVPMDEVVRVLCPNGVAHIKRGTRWETTVKPWPARMDQWTHWLHGSDGNAVADDSHVGPPRHLQWIAEPLWLRHHNMTISFCAMVSAGGRVFYISDDSSPGVVGLPDQWALRARDAFNGVQLWKRPITDWGWSAWTANSTAVSRSRFDAPLDWPRRLLAEGDRVYVTLGEHMPVSVLDAATGQTIREYPGTRQLSEMLLHEGKLIVSVHRPSEIEVRSTGPEAVVPALEKHLLVFAADSGKLLWKKTGLLGVVSKTGLLRRYTHLYLAARDGRLCLVDRESIVSLDLKTGDRLWRALRPGRKEIEAKYGSLTTSNLCTLVAGRDVVLFSQLKAYGRNPWYEPAETTLIALARNTGKPLWQFACGSWNCYSPPDLFVIDGLAWVHTRTKPYEMVGLDPVTGIVKRRIPTNKAMVEEHHHRCYRNKATRRFVLTGRRGVELLDLKTGDNLQHHWTRGACRYGILPCNGLLYVPPNPCICYITAKVKGFVALSSRRTGGDTEPVAARLEKGPAYAAMAGRAGSGVVRAGVEDRDSRRESWPTFRHDAMRTGASTAPVPDRLTPQWRTEIGGRLSAPTVGAGKVFAAAVDEHTLYALDEATGARRWRYTCGGRIDSPPTIHGDRVLLGSADGWIYVLRASDGELIWRFQAAPDRTRVMAFDQLESVWPAHGSVLLHRGIAYASAGRSSFLDGGIVVYALDPMTGKVLQQRCIDSTAAPARQVAFDPKLRYDMPPDRPGAVSDILVSDGSSVYLRHIRLDPEDIGRDLEKEKPEAEIQDVYRRQIPRIYSPGPQVASSNGLLDENWFNQTYWSFARASHCRLLVCDQRHTYGVRAYEGKPVRHARAKFVAGKASYTLFADARVPKIDRIWSVPLPIRVSGMLVAERRLLVAGTEDLIPPDDRWQNIEGRGAGVLALFSTQDGKQVARYRLTAPPVWNGIAAAGGRVYLAAKDGSVSCLGGP